MTVISTVCLVASNLFETKIFAAGPLTLTGGLLIFPIAYILNDCITELFGFEKARTAILLAFSMNLFVVLMAQLVRILPPADFWDAQEHFDYVFKTDLRITAASMIAFLGGSMINALIMDRHKRKHGKKGFGVRAILSTLGGESIDSLIFFPIAFGNNGFKTVLVMMITQIVLKTLYEIIILPVTTVVVKKLRDND